MNSTSLKKWIILSVLFFLPVIFLLFLYPSTHNYNSLDIVQNNIKDVESFTYIEEEKRVLRGNITVVAFLGANPMDNLTVALNLKELIYDKFKGFKKFQLLMIVPNGSEDEVNELLLELYAYDELKYWGFAFGNSDQIKDIHNSLKSTNALSNDLSFHHVNVKVRKVGDCTQKLLAVLLALIGAQEHKSPVISHAE